MKEKLDRNKIKTIATELGYKVEFDSKTPGISVNGIHTVSWRNVRKMLPRRRAFISFLIILIETDRKHYNKAPSTLIHLEMFNKRGVSHVGDVFTRRCQSCGRRFQKVSFRRANTAYVEDKLNFSYECEDCFNQHEEYWEEMWNDHNQGRI